MNVFLFSAFLLILKPISGEDKVLSLCEDPLISAADRLVNNSVRVYRGDYYWEIFGLPDTPEAVGPYKVPYPNMLPITPSTMIMTIITGQQNGFTYKFGQPVGGSGQHWWRWNEDGIQLNGGTNRQGEQWPGDPIPQGGWTAAYNDANLDKNKSYSMMVAFQGIQVYYYNTNGPIFVAVGDVKGYESGQFGEAFPSDLTAAFAYPSVDPKVKYFVYLFQSEKYCYRKINGEKEEKDCQNKWQENKKLFGCNSAPGASKDPKTALPGKGGTSATQLPDQQTTSLAIFATNQNLKVITILTTFSVFFFNLFYSK